MRNRFLHIVCMVTLLMALAIGGLWVRSYRVWDTVVGPVLDRDLGIRSSGGRVLVIAGREDVTDAVKQWSWTAGRSGDAGWTGVPDGINLVMLLSLQLANPLDWRRIETTPQFSYTGRWNPGDGLPPMPKNTSVTCVTLPHWALVVALMLPSVVWAAVSARGRRRWAKGLCETCGYDLRASRDRCPECGRAMAASMVSE